VLRSLFTFRDSSDLGRVLVLLLAWLLLFASETAISRKWQAYFPLYLALQTILIFLLLYTPGTSDFFASLFGLLSMQVVLRLNQKIGTVWIGLVSLLTLLPLLKNNQPSQAIGLAILFTAVNVLLASFALATQRAQAARLRNQALAQELRQSNRQLQAYSVQLEQLAVARERNRLARELHDSVTQTVFSMTLTTQSALLLLERDPSRVEAQLDQLTHLAQGALSEMQVLISELRPEKVTQGGLASALRKHLAERNLRDSLSVSLEVEGDHPLQPAEEQGLFRIAQEALNNIVKHAQVSQARIRLHLDEPPWIEIEDHGQGFDLQKAREGSRVGLVSMHERAAEIGWELEVNSAPGAGTRIHVQKKPAGERRI
jgi:signal transduction histidine kinase